MKGAAKTVGMKIDEYIQQNGLTVRLAMVPPFLMQKFNIEDDVEYFANVDQSRIVGKCAKHGFFAAWRPEGIKSGKVDKDYPELASW